MSGTREAKVVMSLERLALDSFVIFPLGLVTGEGIEPFTVNRQSIELLQAARRRRGTVDLVIDYEHQSLGEGIAPAAGWITDFFEEDNALACSVKWTDRAKGYIKAGEYRYFSPVAKVSADGRLVDIHSFALTNLPLGYDLTPLVAMKQGGHKMKQVFNFLGLPDTGTEEDCISAIKGLIAQREQDRQTLARTLEMSQTATHSEIVAMAGHLKAASKSPVTPACEEILAELGLAGGAGKSEALAAVRVMKQKILTGVSAEEFLIMKKKLAAIVTDGLVSLAMSEGKIMAAQKEWADKYATEDPEGFKIFAKNAPVVVIMKQVVTGEGPEKKAREITAEDRDVMRQMGITEEAFGKANP